MDSVTAASRLCAAFLLLAGSFGAAAQIYSCTDANGKRLTSDRPILDCIDREQRVHNSDGSVRKIVPRTLTAEERAEKEARERDAANDRLTRQDATRRDRNLMVRYPNEAAHQKAREAALDHLRKSMAASELRMAALAKERKPLMDETEFYVGKPLPIRLKRMIDANDATAAAQQALIQDQKHEMERINALYDSELDRLKLLWGGTQPGFAELPATKPAEPSSGKSAAR
ncbi:MAG: DUF4124 domain-containing protein [Rhizobacter sp.]|nr:DUF4124 domain-containing protein [Rhizobacter sp.]